MLTRSLCPVCYKEIEGDVAMGAAVYMVKTCPEHGLFVGMVERDADWFLYCRNAQSTKFYDGYMIDVTSRCNLKCKYCYYPCNGEDVPTEKVVAEAARSAYDAPFILTGGEPTLHPDIVNITRSVAALGETWLLTNGVKLLEGAMFADLLAAGLRTDDVAHVALSFHKESGGKDLEVLCMARDLGVKLGSSFWVVDDVRQIDEAIDTYKEFRDVLCSMRIKAASRLWNTKEAENRVFVSDMLRYLSKNHKVSLRSDQCNKISYASTLVDGLPVMLVSWYDRYNVDLNDIDCPPYYRAKDGTVNNLVTTGILNERTVR